MNNKIKKIAAYISLCCIVGQAAILTSCSIQKYQPNYLVLVNKTNLIDEDYDDTITLVEIENVDGGTYKVEKTTATAFKELADALEKDGVTIGVDSAYRSIEEQIEIKKNFIERYGEEYTKGIVAEPRTSEHHTGLVIDLVPMIDGEWVVENDDMLQLPEIFEIIHHKLPEYGFILRYPKGQESVTGYEYEPWHIRYVGKKAAKEIYEQGVTLEEYLSK